MRPLLFLFFLIISLNVAIAQAQRFITREGTVTFYSDAPLEDIQAESKKLSSIFDSGTDEIAFSIAIKSFQFEKKLMQEHFNEKYMESEKFPTSSFTGKIEGFEAGKTGPQEVVAKGSLTIHGVTKPVEVKGTLVNSSQAVTIKAKFLVKLADYNIAIPQLLWQNIAEQVEVTLDLQLLPKTNN